MEKSIHEESKVYACESTTSMPAEKKPFMTKAEQRKLAKIGLVATLGVVTLTGFIRHRQLKPLHTASGLALIGLSVWHANLYGKAKKH